MPAEELNSIVIPEGSRRNPSGDVLTIRQVNIGQGNLTYIICPNNKRILIDAGSDSMGGITIQGVAASLEYVQAFTWNGGPANWKNQENFLYVDLVILTHSDGDHYNKIPDLLGLETPVQQVYIGGRLYGYTNMAKFRDWRAYDNIATKENPITGKDEQRIQQLFVNDDHPQPLLLCDGSIPGSLRTCEVWALAASVPPAYPGETEPNANSIVVKIIFGSSSAMIPGDATVATEDFLCDNEEYSGIELKTDLLLVPHHGSETSSSDRFVRTVAPEIALVSAQDGNDHGLPRKDIIKRYTTPANMLTDLGQANNHRIETYLDKETESSMTTTKAIWQTGVSGTKSYVLTGDAVMPA